MNIRKTKKIPNKYKRLNGAEELECSLAKTDSSTAFDYLNKRFGKPVNEGSGYLLRYKNVIFEFVDAGQLKVAFYISPVAVQTAEKRRKKALNILARETNLKGCAFPREISSSLYYLVKKRNEQLLENGFNESVFYDTIGEEGRRVLERTDYDYSPEVEAVIREVIIDLKQNKYGGVSF